MYISAVTWRTVYEHRVANAFRSKKNLKMCYLLTNSKHHKSDAFQVAIKLLLVATKEIYMFMNSLSFHCIYRVPLFYICGYHSVQATVLLKVKVEDI